MYTYFSCETLEENLISEEVTKDLILCFKGKTPFKSIDFIRINDHVYHTISIFNEIDVLFNIARKTWRQCEDIITAETSTKFDIFKSRNQVIDLLSICRYSIISCSDEVLKNNLKKKLLEKTSLLKCSASTLSNLNEDSLTKLITTSLQKPDSIVYQYFHAYLDLRWLILTVELICDAPTDIISLTFKNLMKDLICISFKFYSKNNNRNSSDFVCVCIKKVWLLLNEFSEKFFTETHLWDVYNEVVQNHEELFSFWCLCNISQLLYKHNLREGKNIVGNFFEIERKLKSLLLKTKQEELNKSLELLQPILEKYWIDCGKIDPYLLLWDYFYKNINYLNVSIPKSCANAIENFKNITEVNSCENWNKCCFDVFLRMLVVHLKKYPGHWAKLRGRIYSRLSNQKLKEFNEKGIYSVCSLFVVLSSVHFEEMMKKLMDILESLPKEKKDLELIWILYSCIMVLFVENNRSIETPAIQFLKLIEDTVVNRERFHFLKVFVESLDYILNSSNNFKLNQSLLLGNWISKYLLFCQYNDLCHFLNILTWIVEQTKKKEAWFEWRSIFINNVLPALKQNSTTQNSPQQIGMLAALITKDDTDLLNQYLPHFSSDLVPLKVSMKFLITVLEDYPENRSLTMTQEHIILEAWVRFCVLNTENNEELTKRIINFNSFAILDLKEISSEPFFTLIKAFKAQLDKNTPLFKLKEISNVFFGQLNRSIVTFFMTSPTESLTLHVYTCMAVLFYHCSILLYSKAKSDCLLSRLVTTLLLPTEVLMGRSPRVLVLKALEKTWHLFFKGIFNLDYTTDPFLERTLRDLVTRYLPHFSPDKSPFFKYLEDLEIFMFILDRIHLSFLSRNVKTTDENFYKAVKTIHISLEKSMDVNLSKSIVQKILPWILEVLMFHSQKGPAIEVVKFLALSDSYVMLREEIKNSIVVVTEKHLAFNTANYFQMITTIANLIPLDIKEVLPTIKKQISVVERMRGVGFDNTLRQGLDRIEKTLGTF